MNSALKKNFILLFTSFARIKKEWNTLDSRDIKQMTPIDGRALEQFSMQLQFPVPTGRQQTRCQGYRKKVGNIKTIHKGDRPQ